MVRFFRVKVLRVFREMVRNTPMVESLAKYQRKIFSLRLCIFLCMGKAIFDGTVFYICFQGVIKGVGVPISVMGARG